METGTIKLVNPKTGRFSVQCVDGLAVFEWVSWVVLEPGDQVMWEHRRDVRMGLTNVSRENNTVHVYARGWGCSNAMANVILATA